MLGAMSPVLFSQKKASDASCPDRVDIRTSNGYLLQYISAEGFKGEQGFHVNGFQPQEHLCNEALGEERRGKEKQGSAEEAAVALWHSALR